MTESIEMLEIRKIKFENSLRYRKMSADDLSKTFDKSTNNFIEKFTKKINVVALTTPQN